MFVHPKLPLAAATLWKPRLNDTQIREWFEERAKYRWVEHSRFDDGRIRFICPQHAGKFKPSDETREIRGKGRPPNKSAVKIETAPEYEFCCGGSITLSADELDTYQKIPFGTTAFEKSYGRRSQVENHYSGLRRRGGLTSHYCRARGLECASACSPRLMCRLQSGCR